MIDFRRTTRAEHRLFEEKPDRKAEASENGASGKTAPVLKLTARQSLEKNESSD
jgi:hypothetical protein